MAGTDLTMSKRLPSKVRHGVQFNFLRHGMSQLCGRR
jgi:hypothetical protein